MVHGVNVEAQLLGTRGEIGYVVTDSISGTTQAIVDDVRRLPETVRLRLDKYDFAPALADALLRRQRQVSNLVCSDRTGISAYIDMDVASAALGRLLDQGRRVDGGSLFAVWRTVMLALWLDGSEQGRVLSTPPQGIAA